MKLKTDINIEISDFKIDHTHKIVSLGSCFADEIGTMLKVTGFDIDINPIRTTFNIASIFRIVNHAISGITILPMDIHYNPTTGLYHHYDWHSSFNGLDPDEVISHINQCSMALRAAIISADVLVITLGTSIIYTYQEQIVNNCHKMPGQLFEKTIIPLEEQTNYLQLLKECISSINPKVKIIWTVSPVRHIKDGLVDNQLSKSILRCVVAGAVSNGDQYFPSYEIMIDDLRDYRFYKADLIHPNDVAIQYIWQKFSETYFDPNTISISNEFRSIQAGLQHKPLQANSPAYLKHQSLMHQKQQSLLDEHPYLKHRLV